MQIESGKYYKTRDGRKVMAYDNDDEKWPFYIEGKECGWHGVSEHGVSCINRDEFDLISEWQDEHAGPDPLDLAALAAQHGIKITVMIGDAVISYDGRK